MTKIYTAREMREAANTLEVNANDIIADCVAQGGSTNRTLYREYAEDDAKFAAMLRQAADLMEREEKREKKYEYTPRYGGLIYQTHYTSYKDALSTSSGKLPIIRRPVGEWEEVRDGE